MPERDERTGAGRVRANAAYVAARASRDVWPRDEKTGAKLAEAIGRFLDEPDLEQRARIGLAWARRVHGDNNEGCDWCAKHALLVFDAIEDAIWPPADDDDLSAPVSAGEPAQEARDEQ